MSRLRPEPHLKKCKVTKIKVAVPQLNLSCSRRKYCAILRILAAISAGDSQDVSPDGTAQPSGAGEAAAAPHSRPVSSKQQDAGWAARRDSPPAAAWRRAAFEHLLQQLLLGCDGVAGESWKDGQKEVSGHRRSA